MFNYRGVVCSKAQSDEELVRLHLQGDLEAFRELVGRYTGAMYNLAYRYTADRMAAEDIAQETFLRVYQALPRSRLELPFKPWLFRIAVNLCRDWAARKRPLAFAQLGNEDDSLVESIPDEEPLPLERVEAGELEEMVRQAVAELAPPYRVAITLRYTEGLSYQQMAEVLDIPLNTVRTHLFRAKQRLRQVLERWWGGGK